MHVTSKDGTKIGYSKTGSGPALILVDGALCYRQFGPMPNLVKLLEPHFTVYSYDRRGRGESIDTKPYDVLREVEDLQALVAEAGGEAYMYGLSSGAALALETANCTPGVKKLVTYEAPFIVDNTHAPLPKDFISRMKAFLAEGKPGEAVKMFMKLVGAPSIAIVIMRWTPAWGKLVSVADTLPYDLQIVEGEQQGKPLSRDRWPNLNIPLLVTAGGKSPVYMQNGQRALAKIFDAEYRELPGQTHVLKEEAIAPVLIDFFK